MKYTIHAKEDQAGLADLLQTSGIEYKYEDSVFTIDLDEKKNELLRIVLSVYISYTLFKEIVFKELEKMTLTPEEKDAIVEEMIGYYSESRYYRDITFIILNDYLHDAKKVDINSFKKFNMKGFKEEILANLGLAIEDLLLIKEENEESKQLIDLLSEKIVNKNLMTNDTETLSIEIEDSRAVVKAFNDEGKFVREIDVGYLEDIFDNQIKMEIYTENPSELDIALLVAGTYIQLFPVAEIVLHKPYTPHREDCISFVEFMKTIPALEPLKIRYCSKPEVCDSCE